MNMDGKSLYSLIPLDDFKAVLGVDDREDKLARFCLVTATLTIEQYCKRRFLRKKHFETMNNEQLGISNDLFMPLREYPVSKILAVYGNGEIIEPEFYRVVPDCGTDIDISFSIEFSPAIARLGCKAFKAVYWGGYSPDKIPSDLSAACMELASWNLNRYRGKRIGMTGNIKGAGIQGEHFELSMPENVKGLLEPYKRKLI